MQSGSAMNGWAFSENPKERAFKLGEVLGVKTTDTAELMNKLTEFSAKELVDASKVVVQGLVKNIYFMFKKETQNIFLNLFSIRLSFY